MLFFVTTPGPGGGGGCLNLLTGELWGELYGTITGGIGRFELATGTWTAEINGFLVGETQITYTGTFKGTVEIPD